MTNWMTAAGLAFIAGGLATLISFRAVIFGGGARRATRAGASGRRRSTAPAYPPAQLEAAPPAMVRRSREPESAMFPSTEFDRVEPAPPEAEPSEFVQVVPGEAEPVAVRGAARRRRLAGALSGGPAEPGHERSGLASIGLADDDEPEVADPVGDDLLAGGYADPEPDEDADAEPARVDPAYDGDSGYHGPYGDEGWTATASGEHPPATDPWAVRDVDRSDRAYGDRVEDWVRPRYRDLDDANPPAGDYWTPVPDGFYNDPEPSARGYGWPLPVERLPPVPDYEPATGFDLTPVQAAEPTTLVPTWTADEEARRIRLPRSWRNREEGRPPRDEGMDTGPRHGRGERARPRPRPRPTGRPEAGYVSRHSAGPHA